MFKKNLTLLYLFNFIKNLHFFGAVGLAFYLDYGKLDYTRIFLLESAFIFFVFILEIPTGTVADIFGRKYSLALGGLFAGAGFFIFGCTQSYAVYFGANLLCAVGITLFSGADRALFYDTLLDAGKSTEGRHYLGRFEAFGTAGLLCAFPFGSLLAGSKLISYPMSTAVCFRLSGFAFLLSGILALFLYEPPRIEKVKNPVREGLDGLRYIFSETALRSSTLNYITISAVSFFVYWFYQTLTRLAGLPIQVNGFISAGFNLTGLVLLWNVRTIEKRLSLSTTLLVTAFIPGLCFSAMAPLTNHAAITIPLVFLIAAAKQLRGPLLGDLINKEINSRNRATVLSGVSMLERGLVGLLYLPVGYMADRSVPLTLASLGVVALIMAGWSYGPLQKRKGKSERDDLICKENK